MSDVNRRILLLALAAAVGLVALLWLGRPQDGPGRPEGVSPPGSIDPRFQCELSSVPPVPAVGEQFRLRLKVTGELPLNEEEGTLLLGFPHPYYALRSTAPGQPYPPAPPNVTQIKARTTGGALPTALRPTGFGRWYVEVGLPLRIAAGRSVEVDVPGLRAPNRPLDRFEPLLLIDPNGDEDFWRICPGLSLPVTAGPPVGTVAVVPSRASPGAQIALTVRREDAYGNPVGDVSGGWTVRWRSLDGDATVPKAPVSLVPSREGVGRAVVPAPPEGAWVADVSGPGGAAQSNAVLVEAGGVDLGWADLNGHSGLSDGWGTPGAWYEHARNVGTLDAAALSDHDWQLDEGQLPQLLDAAEAANDPPWFVSVPALQINRVGNEVVYLFDPALVPRDAQATGGATTLWAETDIGYPTARLTPDLEGVLGNPQVEVVTHSSIAPSMGTAFPLVKAHPNWNVIQIYSAHGSSECVSCPRSAWHEPSGDDGGWGSVRDALNAGYRLGIIAAGGSHDGRPGNSRWGGQPGGLAGVYWTERSRAGLQEAMRSRRVYGTTGSRTLLEFEVDGVVMGGEVPAAPNHRLRFRVIDAQGVASATIVRNGVEWTTVDTPRGWVELEDPDEGPAWWYLRARLDDGNLAWSSPVFVGP